MRKANEIMHDITATKMAKITAKLYGEDVTNYIMCLDVLEKELDDAKRYDNIMMCIDDAIKQSFQYPLGKATTAITEIYHEKHAHLFLVQTTLGTIYNVKTEDEYGFLIDHYTGFDKDEAVKTYIEAFDQILLSDDEDDDYEEE